ncbi:hypothetical protein [Streptomyces sp. WMMC1477]|uniref:hypothetical protein n=1 Tax=Streptomyces sp. WMMC1477 TaxID=3015155 RepID=UPI0022B6670E|nr:hypothetical protein [Streptomyces sp. WMMC1477]MCZ7430160.1 hypothetical protein [Streptomyces sp. WMMC1477]
MTDSPATHPRLPAPVPEATAGEVAHRLDTATAYPHLAAQLATAVFTAARLGQLDATRSRGLSRDAATLTLPTPEYPGSPGHPHPVPAWARPLLQAATYLRTLLEDTAAPLFSPPPQAVGYTNLTDFAETCRLRPPQPSPPPRIPSARRMPQKQHAAEIHWPLTSADFPPPWTTRGRRTMAAYRRATEPPATR